MTEVASPTSPQPTAVTQVPAGQPGSAEDLERFDELLKTVNNADGQASEDDRVKAYASIHTLGVSGRLGRLDGERAQQLNDLYKGDIAERSNAAHNRIVQSLIAARDRGASSADIVQTALSQFEGLSEPDQKILFETNINATQLGGFKPYKDVNSYKDNLRAQLLVTKAVADSGVVTANGGIDEAAAAKKAAEDPRFAALYKLTQVKNNNASSWTEQVLQLFRQPEDKVDLSGAARSLIGGEPKAKSPVPGYREGALASVKV